MLGSVRHASRPARGQVRCYTQVSVLPNGLKVATQKTFDKTCTVGYWAEAGARFETTQGESRLVDRSFWKGTKTRPGRKLVEEIENMGAKMTANIEREDAHIAITCDQKDVKQGLDLVKDVAFNSGLNADTWQETLEEADADIDSGYWSTADIMYDRMHMNVWRDSGLGNTLHPSDYAKVSHEGCKKFVTDNFVSAKSMITGVGNIEHDKFVAEVSAQFGGMPTGSLPVVAEAPYWLGAMLNYRNDEMGKFAYFILGWKAVSWRSPDAIPFMVISEMLGSWRKNDPKAILPGTLAACRLTNNVANKSEGIGCAEYYESKYHPYRDTGMLSIYMICDELAVEHCRHEAQFNVNMLTGGIQEEEVERSKKWLKMKLFHVNDGTFARANDLSTQVLKLGRYVSPEELNLRIDSVDSHDIKRVAFEHLHDSELAITALGPTHGLCNFNYMRLQNLARRF